MGAEDMKGGKATVKVSIDVNIFLSQVIYHILTEEWMNLSLAIILLFMKREMVSRGKYIYS